MFNYGKDNFTLSFLLFGYYLGIRYLKKKKRTPKMFYLIEHINNHKVLKTISLSKLLPL